MNYPAAELRGIKINLYLINPDAEHRGILLIKNIINRTLHKLAFIVPGVMVEEVSND